jgi:alpha-D-ribose 1-methylphosphonate 5-triphosphate synthase subunit PhnG
MSDTTVTDAHRTRQRWLSELARARRGDLAELAPPVLAPHAFDTLRAPEAGLVMLRGRIGNTGDRFNLGEATVTRCVTRLQFGGFTVAGVGMVLGRDAERAQWVARLDALLQIDACHREIMQRVMEPLAQRRLGREAAEAERTGTSRVQFYTLQPEATEPTA